MTRAQRVCGSTHQANTRSVIRIALRRVPVNAHVEFEIAMRAFGLVHELDGCSGNSRERREAPEAPDRAAATGTMQWYALEKLRKLKKSERALRAEWFTGA